MIDQTTLLSIKQIFHIIWIYVWCTSLKKSLRTKSSHFEDKQGQIWKYFVLIHLKDLFPPFYPIKSWCYPTINEDIHIFMFYWTMQVFQQIMTSVDS